VGPLDAAVDASMRAGTPRRLGGAQEEVAEPGETCPLGAACVVIQDMLALKYGVQIDEADFMTKARARCDPADRSSPARLAAALNTEPALRIKDEANDRLLQLELQVAVVTSFAELRAHVRRFPGSACAVAAVAESGTRRPQVVAVYREAYGETASLVAKTRSQLYGGVAPLMDFREDGFRGAVVLDPVLVRVLKYESQPNMMLDLQVPALSSEYRRGAEGGNDAEADIATRACTALSELAPAPGEMWLRPGGAEAACAFCVGLMSQQLANRSLQVAACRALAGLLPAVTVDASEGQAAVELLAAAMRRHSQCPDVLEAACWALAGSMAMRQDLQAVASSNGASEEVVASMRRFLGAGSEVEDLQTWACGALASLSASNPTQQAAIAGSRGIDAILTAMRLHVDNVRLQHMACGALSNLAANNLNNQAAIAAGGGIDVILQAMQSHPDETTVLQSAIAALWCLVKNNPEHRTLVTRARGVEYIVNAVQSHPYDAELKAMASGALQVLVPGLGEALAGGVQSQRQAPDGAWGSPPRTPSPPLESPSSPEAASAVGFVAAQSAAPSGLSARGPGGAAAALPGMQAKAAASAPSPASPPGASSVPISARGPRSAAWSLETTDDDDDDDSFGGAIAQPPGMTARGARPAGSLPGMRAAPALEASPLAGAAPNGMRKSVISFG